MSYAVDYPAMSSHDSNANFIGSYSSFIQHIKYILSPKHSVMQEGFKDYCDPRIANTGPHLEESSLRSRCP